MQLGIRPTLEKVWVGNTQCNVWLLTDNHGRQLRLCVAKIQVQSDHVGLAEEMQLVREKDQLIPLPEGEPIYGIPQEDVLGEIPDYLGGDCS